MKKLCRKCKIEKNISQFYVCKACKGGYRHSCKKCHTTDTEKARLSHNVNERESRRLRYRYGITLEDYNYLFDFQNGCCAICNRHQSTFEKRLFVDHNHTTGIVRGLLCDDCNKAIGILREDIESLRNAIDYLIKHNNRCQNKNQ